MAVLTIGGKDYQAAFNLRALRLFKKETGRSLQSALAELKSDEPEDGDSEDGEPVEIEVDFGTIAYIIWALANAKPNGPDFEIVESSIDINDLKLVMEQLSQIMSVDTGDSKDPLAKTTEETSQ